MGHLCCHHVCLVLLFGEQRAPREAFRTFGRVYTHILCTVLRTAELSKDFGYEMIKIYLGNLFHIELGIFYFIVSKSD